MPGFFHEAVRTYQLNDTELFEHISRYRAVRTYQQIQSCSSISADTKLFEHISRYRAVRTYQQVQMLQIVITTLNVLSRSLVKMVEFPNFEYFFPTLEAQERRGELAGSVHSNPDTRLNTKNSNPDTRLNTENSNPDTRLNTEDLNKSTRLNREFKSRYSLNTEKKFKSKYSSEHGEFKSKYSYKQRI